MLGGMSDRTALWAAGDRMTLILTGADTSGSCFVMEQVVPRHVRPPGRHAHARESHVWYVQDGHGRFYVGESVTEAGPGAILFGPPGIPQHMHRNFAGIPSVPTDDSRQLVPGYPGFSGHFDGQDAGLRPICPKQMGRVTASVVTARGWRAWTSPA